MAAPPISGYLFRSCFPLMGNDEAQLLRPRDPKGTKTARDHVRLASKPDYPTQWVSLTASSDWVLYYALKDYVTNNRQVLSKIMVFDRHRIPPQLSNRVLDLSTAEAWSSCPDTKDCKIKDPTKNYAISAEEWLLNAGDVTGSVWKQFTVGIVTILDLEEPRAVRGGLLQKLVKILVADRIKVDAANLEIKDPKKHQVPVAMLSYKEWRKRLTAGFEGIYLTGRGGIHSWFTQLIRDKLVLLPAAAPSSSSTSSTSTSTSSTSTTTSTSSNNSSSSVSKSLSNSSTGGVDIDDSSRPKDLDRRPSNNVNATSVTVTRSSVTRHDNNNGINAPPTTSTLSAIEIKTAGSNSPRTLRVLSTEPTQPLLTSIPSISSTPSSSSSSSSSSGTSFANVARDAQRATASGLNSNTGIDTTSSSSLSLTDVHHGINARAAVASLESGRFGNPTSSSRIPSNIIGSSRPLSIESSSSSSFSVAPVPGLPVPDSNAFDDAKRASIHPSDVQETKVPAHNIKVPGVTRPTASSPRSPLADRSQLMRDVITAGQKDLYKIACKVQQATNRPPITTKGKGRSLEVVRRELLVEMENHTTEESARAA